MGMNMGQNEMEKERLALGERIKDLDASFAAL